jgi:hypothetical protein
LIVRLGGHDHHSASSKEIDPIGRVVCLPQVRALRETPDAAERGIARQMVQRDAGQRLAVAMMWKLWPVHASK